MPVRPHTLRDARVCGSARPAAHDPTRSRQAGFTLIELMGTLGILMLLAVVGFPAFSRWVDQQRLLGFVNDSSVQLVRARQEAIQRGVPVVAQPDTGKGVLRLWADVDDDLAFDPDTSAVNRTTDYSLGQVMLPTQSTVLFGGPEGMIEGLTSMPDGLNAFVFERDGSVRDVGALRISDDRGNSFELRVEPKATGKTRVRMYNGAPSWGDPAGYYEKGNVPSTGAPTWVWNGSAAGSGGGGGKGGGN
jgi:type IV fimbrial biogenesis protein FimT